MKTNTSLLIVLLCLFGMTAQAQQKISGTIIDQETNEPLPFSSIAVPNTTSGTMTNADGEFELQLKEGQNEIQISYVGYVDTLIIIDPDTEFYEIEVAPYAFELTEIIVFNLTPLEYIIKALEKHPSLIPNQPFESQAFFASKSALKNDADNSYEVHQAVYNTYFSDYANDTLKEDSQLILYNHIQEGGFESILERNKRINKMAKRAEKKELKEEKKNAKKGIVDEEEADEESEDGDESLVDEPGVSIDVNGFTGAGPSQALKKTKSITRQDFFNEFYFKKFTYTFGEQTFYQGRELIKINFSNKRKVEHTFYNGSIYLDYEDLAIVAIDYNQRFKLPFYINALLKPIIGISIDEIAGDVRIRNQPIDGKWYPKELVNNIDLTIKQKKELETLTVAQVLNFGKITLLDPVQIEKEKVFTEEEEYEVQIYSIPGVEWEDVNVVKL